MPKDIPKNNKPNCNANITKPYKATIRNGTAGGLIKKIAGMLAKINRTASSNNGEISLRPSLTKRKFMPQITTTNKANNICEIGIIGVPLVEKNRIQKELYSI